jgi:hypothetical protein
MRQCALTALCLATLAAVSACHHRRPPLAPALPPPIEDYCWWTYQSTALAPDAVARRFAEGFAAAGFDHVQPFRAGDTAWVVAGPTPLESRSGRSRWSARVVAYAVGDSARFRLYVGLGPRFARWATAADSVAAESDRIPMCGRVLSAAAVPSARPRRDPNALDSLPVWRHGVAR